MLTDHNFSISPQKVLGRDSKKPLGEPINLNAELVLWDDVLSPAPIFIPDNAFPRLLEGANHLADIIAKSSGKTRPSVVQQATHLSTPQRAILVAYPTDALKYEESIISCSEGGPLILVGEDEFDFNNPDWVGSPNFTNYMTRSGTYNAIMTFIQDYLGVVYGWPGQVGTAVPRKSEFSLKPFEKRYIPSTKFRQFLYFSRPGHSRLAPAGVLGWYMRQRCVFTPRIDDGHGFYHFYDRFHPNGTQQGNEEYLFALQPNGLRDGYNYGGNAKMEIGEPDLVEKWFQVNVVEGLAANPLRRLFNCSSNDSWLSGHSVDPRARAMDYTGPSPFIERYDYATGSIFRYSITDREMKFANLCAERMAIDYPNYWVMQLAYGVTRATARREQPADNLIVVNVPNDYPNPTALANRFLTGKYQTGRTHLENLEAWLLFTNGKNHVWRPNMSNGFSAHQGLWLTDIHYLGNKLKHMISKGLVGIMPSVFREYWATQWPIYYIVSQLLWDHNKSIDETIDYAYTTLFGPAATPIKSYYEATEELYDLYRNVNTNYNYVWRLYDEAFIDRLRGYLDQALLLSTPGSEEYTRVEWVIAGFNHSEKLLRCIEYTQLYPLAAEITDTTNIVNLPNAMELDVNSTDYWGISKGFGKLESQAEITNSSNYAIKIQAFRRQELEILRTATISESPDELYIVSMDVIHLDGGSFQIVRLFGQGGSTIITPTITNTMDSWNTIMFPAFGRDKIVIKLSSIIEEDSSICIDNLKIQRAIQVDSKAIRTHWLQLLGEMSNIRADPRWEGALFYWYITTFLPNPNSYSEPTIPGDLI
jgi:hypothetical protein